MHRNRNITALPDRTDQRALQAISPPTLPRSVAVLVEDGEKSPIEWHGDWYQAGGRWHFQPRYSSSDYRYDPATLPEPVKDSARETLALLERGMAPASMDEIQRGLAEMALVLGHKAGDGEEVWAARYAIYARLLEDIPRDILRHAMDAHTRNSVFFPKVSELRERADPMFRARRKHIQRLRDLLGMDAPEKTIFEQTAERLRMGRP